ncbi:MAG: hypothetical protein KGP28_09295 [Bdellovibrionales bacterium]|nr:hypothetical protein [Bdellovibrionales bacterium]
MRWWLIRHPDQTFSRPIPELSLISKIEAGELSLKDEICPSAGYWFPIQDAAEVRKFLGDIKLDRNLPNDGVTSTTLQGGGKTDGNAVPSREDERTPKEGREPIRPPFVQSGSKGHVQPALSDGALNEASFDVLEEEPEVSVWSQIAFIFVIVLIFCGTVYLLWTNSRK